MSDFKVCGDQKPILIVSSFKEEKLKFDQEQLLIYQKQSKTENNQSFRATSSKIAIVQSNKPQKPLDRVTITIGNDPDPDYKTAIVQTLQGKAFLGRVHSLDALISNVTTYVREINKGKPLSYVQIEGHGYMDGKIKFSKTNKIYMDKLISTLIKNKLIKKNSTVEFFCCLVGQAFNYVKEIARKYGITIKAANYLQTIYGVNGIDAAKVERENKGAEVPYHGGSANLKVPITKQVITFKDGKAFGEDGKEIHRVEYKT